MRSELLQLARFSIAVLFIAVFAFPKPTAAQAQTPRATQHLVSPDDLQNAVVDASQSRQQNIDALNSFLSIPQARQALQSAHVSPQQVNKAVAGMSDEELAQLAARASKAQSDFAAGSLGDRDLLIIVLCIVALILIIVAVH